MAAIAHLPDLTSEERAGLAVGCGEIKCPWTKTLYSAQDKHGEMEWPRYYYDQIQGQMAINAWPWCDTVVFTPDATQVIRFAYDDTYWSQRLLPALRRFYFNTFLPRLKLRAQGRLPRNEVDPLCILTRGLTLPAFPSSFPVIIPHLQQVRAAKAAASQKRTRGDDVRLCDLDAARPAATRPWFHESNFLDWVHPALCCPAYVRVEDWLCLVTMSGVTFEVAAEDTSTSSMDGNSCDDVAKACSPVVVGTTTTTSTTTPATLTLTSVPRPAPRPWRFVTTHDIDDILEQLSNGQ